MGGLTAPLFNRRRLKADQERTVAESRQALYSYRKTVLSSFQEVSNSLKSIENYEHMYALKQEEVKALNDAVAVANDLYLVGRANYLEIITAQRKAPDAELELANTKKNIYRGHQPVQICWRRLEKISQNN
ncbi:TolC family protein [Mucilaginibacter limnophilus]|uniref:TolC family protein n=1 Tax=Mucilaginibacter limnophilus TaxID=1932778 RepID=UPI0021D3E9FC|nr:TolC family protein [Mucilaginibacter limnophilus]